MDDPDLKALVAQLAQGQAQLLEAMTAREKERAGPARAPSTAVVRVGELADRYYRAEGRFLGSAKEVRHRTKRILATKVILPGENGEVGFADVQLSDVGAELIAELRKVWQHTTTRYGRPTRPATRNRMVALVRRWFSWGAAQRPPVGGAAPLRNIPQEEENNINKAKVDGEAALARLLAACRRQGPDIGPVLAAYVLALHDSGQREMELLELEWDGWDHKTGRQSMLKTKNDEARIVVHSARARTAMLALPRVCKHVFANPATKKHYAPGWISNVFKRAAREAGMPTLTLHKTRHSFTYNARRFYNLPETTTRVILGHKTDSAFRRYGIVDRAEVLAAFKERDRFLREGPAADDDDPQE